jgi:hypothetical protein
VVIEAGRVMGMDIEEGERVIPTLDTRFLAAPVVVSAVAIWDLFSIVSEDDLPPWYAQRLLYLHRKTLNVATLTVALDQPGLWGHSGQRWVDRGPVSGRPWCA